MAISPNARILFCPVLEYAGEPVENHAVARITLVAMIFLPFSTVAAILGMPGNFAPGSDYFWVFWAVVLPLTALIIGSFALYDGFRRYMLNEVSGQSSDKLSRSSSKTREPSCKQEVGTTKEHLPPAAGWLVKSWQDNRALRSKSRRS